MTRILFALTAVLGLSLSSSAQSIGPDDLRLQWQQFRLDNGLRVLLQPDSSQQDVSIEFWVLAGIRDEEPGRFGLAHFAEHSTPYGLRDDTTALKHLRSMMTNSNAQTRKDYTRYYIQVKREVLALGLRYAADRFRADTRAITNELVERHRKNVLAEIDRNSVNAFWGYKDVFVREAGTFGIRHPYGHSGYGTPRENESFTTHDVRSWYKRFVNPHNTILFLAGGLDSKEARRLVTEEFGAIKNRSAPTETPAAAATNSNRKMTIKSRSRLHTLSLTWALPKEAFADEAPLALAAFVIDARLADSTQLPRVDKAGSSSLMKRYLLAGSFGVFATFNNHGDSAAIESQLRRVASDVMQRRISEDELRHAKDQAKLNMKEAMEELGFAGSRTTARRRAVV